MADSLPTCPDSGSVFDATTYITPFVESRSGPSKLPPVTSNWLVLTMRPAPAPPPTTAFTRLSVPNRLPTKTQPVSWSYTGSVSALLLLVKAGQTLVPLAIVSAGNAIPVERNTLGNWWSNPSTLP